jgi:hypothetical protein
MYPNGEIYIVLFLKRGVIQMIKKMDTDFILCLNY